MSFQIPPPFKESNRKKEKEREGREGEFPPRLSCLNSFLVDHWLSFFVEFGVFLREFSSVHEPDLVSLIYYGVCKHLLNDAVR